MATKAQLAALAAAKKKRRKHGSKHFNPPWLKAGKEPNGKSDPVPPAVRARLAKKYG
jgi:hypothetical protein